MCIRDSPHVMGILPVSLLGPAPGRVAQHVDADASVQVGADRPQLATDGVADALFELGIPGRTPRHTHRETGGLVDHDPSRAIGEGEAGDAEPCHLGGPERALVVARLPQIGEPGPERGVAVKTPELLVVGHLLHDRADPVDCPSAVPVSYTHLTLPTK